VAPAVFDASSRAKLDELTLPAHPEYFGIVFTAELARFAVTPAVASNVSERVHGTVAA
jgi:hypothetical protein